jgi:hypothetical protein
MAFQLPPADSPKRTNICEKMTNYFRGTSTAQPSAPLDRKKLQQFFNNYLDPLPPPPHPPHAPPPDGGAAEEEGDFFNSKELALPIQDLSEIHLQRLLAEASEASGLEDHNVDCLCPACKTSRNRGLKPLMEALFDHAEAGGEIALNGVPVHPKNCDCDYCCDLAMLSQYHKNGQIAEPMFPCEPKSCGCGPRSCCCRVVDRIIEGLGNCSSRNYFCYYAETSLKYITTTLTSLSPGIILTLSVIPGFPSGVAAAAVVIAFFLGLTLRLAAMAPLSSPADRRRDLIGAHKKSTFKFRMTPCAKFFFLTATIPSIESGLVSAALGNQMVELFKGQADLGKHVLWISVLAFLANFISSHWSEGGIFRTLSATYWKYDRRWEHSHALSSKRERCLHRLLEYLFYFFGLISLLVLFVPPTADPAARWIARQAEIENLITQWIVFGASYVFFGVFAAHTIIIYISFLWDVYRNCKDMSFNTFRQNLGAYVCSSVFILFNGLTTAGNIFAGSDSITFPPYDLHPQNGTHFLDDVPEKGVSLGAMLFGIANVITISSISSILAGIVCSERVTPKVMSCIRYICASMAKKPSSPLELRQYEQRLLQAVNGDSRQGGARVEEIEDPEDPSASSGENEIIPPSPPPYFRRL